MIPTLSQVCCLHSPFDRDLEDFAAGKLPERRSLADQARRLLEIAHAQGRAVLARKDSASTLPVASFQGGLLASQGEARREAWELFAPPPRPVPRVGHRHDRRRLRRAAAALAADDRARAALARPGRPGSRPARRAGGPGISSRQRFRQQPANRRGPRRRSRQPAPGPLPGRLPLPRRPQQDRRPRLPDPRQPLPRPALRPGRHAPRAGPRLGTASCPATATSPSRRSSSTSAKSTTAAASRSS